MTYIKTKKYIKGVFAIALTLSFTSCVDNGYEEFQAPTGNVNNIQPNTQFTTSTDADDSMAIIFRSYSTDAASYSWEFGDGGTSADADPNYTYTDGGKYTVKLTTVSSDGLNAVDSTEVAPIFVDFNIKETVDTEVTFENLTDGAKELTWDFGDGETVEWSFEDEDGEANDDFNPTHTYTSDDTFVATLTATNFLDNVTVVSKNIEGLVLSTIPDFTFDVDGLNVDFTDASTLAVTHSWDFGDGATSTDVNPSHTFAEEGSFIVTLTTTNTENVSRTITKTVPVGAVKATFAAVILNGSIDEIIGTDLNDNADAFDMTPNSTVKDALGGNVTSPFTGWKNSTLNTWIEDNISTSNEAPGGSSTANSAPRSLKLHEKQRRAYQPFTVEPGVVYTIKLWVKAEGVGAVSVYIMDNEIENELTLDTENLGTVVVTGGDNNSNSFQQYEFNFEATTSTALFYAKPSGAIIDGSNEIWIDDIEVITPGF